MRVFESVVAVVFRAKKYTNNVFLFLKNYFWYQHIKTVQKIQITLNFSKKKKFKFFQKTGSTAMSNGVLVIWFLDLVAVFFRGCLGIWLLLLFKVKNYFEKHVNNIFLFLKNYFWDQHIKMIWKHQKHIHSKQKKNLNFIKSIF